MKKRANGSSRVKRHEILTLEVLKQFRLVYGAVHRHFRAVERQCGLSGAQAWILRELDRTPSLGVSELATRLSVHQSTASQLVEKLVSSGHVERVAHRVDARRVHLHLTRKGTACVRRLPEPAEGVLPRALGRLPAASLRALNVNLARLTTQLKTRHDRDAQSHLSQL
jgi:DNA-binding MarR family transcriptional regulator